jgi:hypothetical protein
MSPALGLRSGLIPPDSASTISNLFPSPEYFTIVSRWIFAS